MATTESVSIIAGTNTATVEVTLTSLELAMLRDRPDLVRLEVQIFAIPAKEEDSAVSDSSD